MTKLSQTNSDDILKTAQRAFKLIDPTGAAQFSTSNRNTYMSLITQFLQDRTGFEQRKRAAATVPGGSTKSLDAIIKAVSEFEGAGLGELVTDVSSGQAPTGGVTPTPTQPTENKMPSGVLVRNPTDNKVFFVDADKKLRHITDPALIQGKEIIDVDNSHFEGIDFGADITEQPPFDFPTSGSQAKFDETGIDFTQPRGFDVGEAGGVVDDVTSPTGEPTPTGGLPSEITESEEYGNLSDELKSIVELMFQAQEANDEETARLAQEAIDQAIEIADPFSKIMIAFAQDAIPDTFNVRKQSVQDQITSSQETLDEIGKLMEESTLEEQQALGAISKSFENKILNLEDQAAGAGLTFSSKRSDLESFVGQQNIDLVQSTERGFGKSQRKLETAKKEQQRQEKLIKEAGEAQLKAIARGAEQLLGTEEFKKFGLKGLGGEAIQPIGGKEGVPEVGGTIEQQRQAQILNLATLIRGFGGESLESLFNQ